MYLDESNEDIESEKRNFNVREIDHFEVFDKEMSEVFRRESDTQSHASESEQIDPSKWSADPIIGSLNTAKIIGDTGNFTKNRTEVEPWDVFHAGGNDCNFKPDRMKQANSYTDAVLENDPPVNGGLAVPIGHSLDSALSDFSLNAKDLAIYRPTEDLSEDQNDSLKVQSSVCHVVGDTEVCCSRKDVGEEHANNIDEIIGIVVEASEQPSVFSTICETGHEEKVARLDMTNSYDCTREGLKETHTTQIS